MDLLPNLQRYFQIPIYLYLFFSFGGVLIAGFQVYREKENKLKISSNLLYEKRKKVFLATKSFLEQIVWADSSDKRELFQKFKEETEEGHFVFDSEISNYFKIVYEKALRLHSRRRILDNERYTNMEKRAEYAREEDELQGWLENQLNECREKFSKFLRV